MLRNRIIRTSRPLPCGPSQVVRLRRHNLSPPECGRPTNDFFTVFYVASAHDGTSTGPLPLASWCRAGPTLRESHVIPKYVIPKYVIPKYVIPKYVIPKYVIPKYVIPKYVIPKYVIPKYVIPKQVIPKHVISNHRRRSRRARLGRGVTLH